MPQSISTSRHPIYCLDCGYVLNGVADASCPECGRGFSSRDPSSYTTYHKYVHKKVLDAALTPGLLRGLGVINGIVCALALLTVVLAFSSPRLLWRAGPLMLVAAVFTAGLCVACTTSVATLSERKALIPGRLKAFGVINGIVCALALVSAAIAFASHESVRPALLWMLAIGVVCAGLCVACMIIATKRCERTGLNPGPLRAIGAISGIVWALAVVTVILAFDRTRVDWSVLTGMSLLGMACAGLCVAWMMIATMRR